LTRRKFTLNTEDPKILGDTVQNLVATATRLLGLSASLQVIIIIEVFGTMYSRYDANSCCCCEVTLC